MDILHLSAFSHRVFVSFWMLCLASVLYCPVAAGAREDNATSIEESAAPSEGTSDDAEAIPSGSNAAGDKESLSDNPGALNDALGGFGSLATKTAVKPLSGFLSGKAELNLRSSSATADISVPIPAAWNPEELVLRLRYRNSVSLIEAHSQLRVELNGLIIAQFRLDPDRPQGEARISLPVELLNAGYNQLRFTVAQHTVVGECEDPLSPELWTQVDTANSSLNLTYKLRRTSLTLAEVDDLLGKYAWNQARIGIAMKLGADGPSLDQLEWGALVAQGAAIRLKYRSLEVNLLGLEDVGDASESSELLGSSPDGLILVGTVEELTPLLGADWADSVTESYLGLVPPESGSPAAMDRLVVSGRAANEVRRAAIALGLIDLPLPDRQDVLIGEIKLPDFPRDTGPRALLGGTAASFADLGFKTVTLGSSLEPANTFPTAGRSSGTAEILKTSTDLDFWVPAGFYPGRHQEGIIALDFSYGAKLRSDSVLNIALNGIFVRAIPLDDPVGATQLGYQVRFPFELLVAGRNQLTLSPRMVPSFTDVCQLRQGENLRFTLFESSSVMLPDVERIVSLPDLGVFSRAGFPLLENPTGSEFGVQFGSRHPATVAAAWTLLGRLAQLVQIPLYRAELSYDPFPDKFSWLLVAPITDVDVELRADSPILERDGRFWVKYPLLDLFQPLKPEGNWAERGLARLQRLFEPPASVVDVREADVGFEDAERTSPLSATVFGRQGGLFQLQAESAQKTPVVMLTAATPELLHARAARLVQPDFWYNLSGGFALWDDREDSLTTVRTKHRFTVGQVSPPDRLNFLLNTYPEALVAIVLLLILLFASLLFAVVRRFRRHARIVSATED